MISDWLNHEFVAQANARYQPSRVLRQAMGRPPPRGRFILYEYDLDQHEDLLVLCLVGVAVCW
jgi:hypothetical protein